jgi:hypothetical protein
MNLGVRFGRALAMLGVALLFAFSTTASAMDVAGVKLDDTAHVGTQDLKLNGAGIRYKLIFKVYVAGLYLAEKKTSVQDILAVPGAKRVSLVMLRDVQSEDFGQAFMDGLRKNTELSERTRIVTQELAFGQLFASVPELKKGDMLTIDWLPGTGTLVSLNGKKIAEPQPDVLFYNALMKIWLGPHPADAKLKVAMMGGDGQQ